MIYLFPKKIRTGMKNVRLMNLLGLALFLLLTASFSVSASPVDTYQFKDEVTKTRFNALNKELRCPKCLNQNLADSNSPIAEDLRREVYELLNEGKADVEIMDYMVARYGEFVLYRPRVNSLTYILWFGPALLILLGLIVLVAIIRRKPIKREKVVLTEDQQNKLKEILKD